MIIPPLAYVAFFFFRTAAFLTRLLSSLQALLQNSYFIKVISSIHQSSYFPGATSFLEQLLFLSISFHISSFFRAKPPPSCCFLRINISLGGYFFRIATYLEDELLFHVRYLYTAPKFQNSYFFNKATSTIQVLLSAVNFSEKLLFWKQLISQKINFMQQLLLGELLY